MAQWNCTAALFALLLGAFLQSVVLPCLCSDGSYKMYMAGVMDLGILIRILIARRNKERGKGWVFYAILPFLLIPVIEFAVAFRLMAH